ncbi:MAG: hypothetical protein EOP87_10010 [Verrucomicrobiaceae bacterium]|nr:MAG: hypothetical protein EOP87_10010 [Verrucomicrobiaceae bacterium]
MKSDLRYFRNSMSKRFPDCNEKQIEQAIAKALEEIKPSRDRTRLNRLVIAMLSQHCGDTAAH